MIANTYQFAGLIRRAVQVCADKKNTNVTQKKKKFFLKISGKGVPLVVELELHTVLLESL